MDKMIKVLERPSPDNITWGIYKVLIQNEDNETYEAHLVIEEYKVRVLKEKLYFDYKVPEKIINEFEDAVRDLAERSTWDVY